MRPLDLPELAPALLDAAAVARFFEDVAFETTVLQIAAKGGVGGDQPASLREAREAFHSGAVTELQIRYVHRGVEWWDTVVRTADGVRIVRIRK